MGLKVVVAGSTGWVGRELVRAILSTRDMELVGAIARSAAGSDAATAIGLPPCGVTISDRFDEAMAASADVLIDYTRTEIAKKSCMTALSANCAVVLGSSGLQADDFAQLDEMARQAGVGVIAAGNFSITATLMKRFALAAAQYVADVELIDYASSEKPDTPSGTTTELADALAEIRQAATSLPVDTLIGMQRTRGEAMGTPRPVQVHAVRMPSYALSVEALFGKDGERLSIRHDAGASAKPYVGGTLLAARRVRDLVGLTRGIEKFV